MVRSMAAALADSAITPVGMASVLVRNEPAGPWTALFYDWPPVQFLFRGVKIAVATVSENAAARHDP
jgi:hypothetical protein